LFFSRLNREYNKIFMIKTKLPLGPGGRGKGGGKEAFLSLLFPF